MDKYKKIVFDSFDEAIGSDQEVVYIGGDTEGKHIVDHTRLKNGKKRYSICGERISSLDWTFHDKEHAEKTIESGSPINVCEKCLNKNN